MQLELARTPQQAVDAVVTHLRRPDVADDLRRDHLRIVTGPQPYRHAYYAWDQFFRFEPNLGAIHTVHGQRVLLTTGNFIRALTEGVASQGSRDAQAVLERLGRAWAEATFRDFVPRVEQEFEIHFDKMGLGMVLETWWWPMRAAGWGSWHVDFRHARRGLVRINLSESMFVRALGRMGQPVCGWYSGMFAGVFSRLARRDLAAVEVSCVAATSEASCTFLVGTPTRVRAAREARDQGAQVDEIIQCWLAPQPERAAATT
ncbi:MAG: hypothetical protein N2039_03440 [Gemmataceae bacterium]|nr:hypothetical protein [Gemmataceae bacterium]